MRNENLNAWWYLLGHSIHLRAEQLADEIQKRRITGRKEEIFPAQKNIFRALELTAPGDVKVVILGQDPYHTPGMADGLAFSVPDGTKIPPSLRNIKKEIEYSLGIHSDPSHGDLSRWAKQGVLLLNTILTVEKGSPNSHALVGWQEITTEIVYACMRIRQPVVFLSWGKPAFELINACKTNATNKIMLASTHPSPLSASKRANYAEAFLGSDCFRRANEILETAGLKPIDWTI